MYFEGATPPIRRDSAGRKRSAEKGIRRSLGASGRGSGRLPALHFAYYNLCRIQRLFRVRPAMEAGVTDHVWTLREMLTR